MEKLQVMEISRQYSNFGQHCEQALAYTLTGEIRKHDNVPFYKGSDIPEYAMSVKSSGFSLASGKQNKGDNFDEKVADFFRRVHSKQFAYVSKDMNAYIMNKREFRKFVNMFCVWTYESEQNGGYAKVRCNKESKKMVAWLESQVA